MLNQDEKANRARGATGGKTAVFLSVFVFPGAGQFVQKRPLAGALFVILFLLCVAVFLADAGRIIMAFYRLGLDATAYDAPTLPLGGMLAALAASLLVYLVNIVDAAVAMRRRSRG
jgi:TM2 domain-containing membrane protein YozV